MKFKFDFLLVSHAKPNVGTFNSFLAYAQSICRVSDFKVAIICPSEKNFIGIKTIKIQKNLYIINLPNFNYHEYFNLQILRLICLCILLLLFKYKSVLASGFSQPQICIPITLAKIIKNIRVIYLWDDMWGNGLGIKLNKFINNIFLICEKISFKYCDYLIYPSGFFENKIKKLKIKSTKIYQPYISNYPKNHKNLSIIKKKLNIKKNSKVITCMGNAFFDTENLILKTLDKIKEKNFICIFIGKFFVSDKNQIKYKNIIKKNIINIGFIDNKKYFNELMDLSDIFILPMARNIIEKSRFPVRLLDYLGRNKIIVTNATGELKKLFEKYKIGIITSYSPQSFSKGIQKALTLKKNRKKFYISQQKKIIFEEFNFKTTAKKLIKILNK